MTKISDSTKVRQRIEWPMRTAKRLFKESRRRAFDTDVQLAATQEFGVIPQAEYMALKDSKVMLALAGTENFLHADPDDFVISLRSFEGGIERCFSAGCVSPAYTVLKPTKDVESRFYAYLLKSRWFVQVLQSRTTGIREGKTVTYAQFGSTELPVPPIAEQANIADFLDRETAKADALVAKYERLIELLEEKRVALITHAVTKGLDSNAPMKDSGIVGIGEVPEHWGVAAVWMLFEIGRGRVISHEDIANNPGEYPVYSSQTENEGEMGRIGTFDFDGDYLTWTTDGARAGTVFERHGRFNCTNVCGTLHARNTEIDLSYFRYTIDIAGKFFVRLDINPKLMNDVMARIRVPVPPIAEQRTIIQRIHPQLRPLEDLRQRAVHAIGLVREHRSALITAAVTGQIDVRIYKAKELEEVVA